MKHIKEFESLSSDYSEYMARQVSPNLSRNNQVMPTSGTLHGPVGMGGITGQTGISGQTGIAGQMGVCGSISYSSVVDDRIKRIEARIKAENRQSKIDSVLQNKAYVEKNLADDDEFMSVMGVGAKYPTATPSPRRRRISMPRIDIGAVAARLGREMREPSPEVAWGVLAAAVAVAVGVALTMF